MVEENELSLEIICINDLLKFNIFIPIYQRPYRWTTESAAMLFDDTYSAFINNVPEYRIGTVVLHNDDKEFYKVDGQQLDQQIKKDKFYIVDGQQRLTTLSILVYCFFEILDDKQYKNSTLLTNDNYNELSTNAIVNNYEILKRKCSSIDKSKLKQYAEYLLNNCTIVCIVTKSEQEAFQFFDSQNSRGKELSPHDLLKSYHLREMNDESEEEKVKIINNWENTNQTQLELLFKNNLYPLVNWYKYLDGLDYSVKDIKTFKGIKKDNNYNFAMYHKSSNLYVEHFNKEGMYELVSGSKINQFQLTQPIIAGKRFFLFAFHYFKLYKEVEELIELKYKDGIPARGAGDIYIKNLFINVVMFFVDKFNMAALTDARLYQLYCWSYSLRLVMQAVYRQSINKYAKGQSNRINEGLNIFQRINEMQQPEELDNIILQKIDKALTLKLNNSSGLYDSVLDNMKGMIENDK